MHLTYLRNRDKASPTGTYRQLALAVGFSVALVFLLSTLFMPTWETNDDVGMSMIAHGYGFIAQSSPNLIFSNVLWGRIVQAMPQFGNAMGYTVASWLVMTASCAATLYFLTRLGVAWINAMLCVVMVFIWPVLFPQFTLNAGLLAVAAILGWRAYGDSGGVSSLATATLLAFLSYLIRDQEFWLVLALSLPILPWKALLRDRKLQIALLMLAVSIAMSSMLNKASYETGAWKAFKEFNMARAPYTDFGAGDQVKARPDILARHGYSNNDIDLVSNWFFVDPRLLASEKLNAMVRDVGVHQWVQRGFGLGIESLRQLSVDRLWPLVITALIIALIARSREALILGVFALAAAFALGAIGRPGVTRVHYPIWAFVLLAAACGMRTRPNWMQAIAGVALALGSLATLYLVWPHQVEAKSRALLAQEQLKGLPSDTLFVWGAEFPYEAAFPPFTPLTKAKAVRIYPMGVSTLAPFSVAIEEEAAGRGFVTRMASDAGLNMSFSPSSFDMLRIYCAEHFQSQLASKVIYQLDSFVVQSVRCRPEVKQIEAEASALSDEHRKLIQPVVMQ